MNRKEALKSLAIFFGTAISAGTTNMLFSSYTLADNEKNAVKFTAAQLRALTAIADVIIPTTKSAPGAKSAGVGKFIPLMVTDCYTPKQQLSFYNGLVDFERLVKAKYPSPFEKLVPTQQKQLLETLRLDTIAQKKLKNSSKIDISYFFTIVRDLTILGYFNSEIGCTQARAYLPIPGSYDGATLLKPGQKSWAT